MVRARMLENILEYSTTFANVPGNSGKAWKGGDYLATLYAVSTDGDLGLAHTEGARDLIKRENARKCSRIFDKVRECSGNILKYFRMLGSRETLENSGKGEHLFVLLAVSTDDGLGRAHLG